MCTAQGVWYPPRLCARVREEEGCGLSGDGSSSDYFAEGWVAEHSNASRSDFIFVERTVAGASAGFSSTWHLCTLLTLAFGIVERCPHCIHPRLPEKTADIVVCIGKFC